MGIKKKHVPGNTCCGVCSYTAPDGNEYADAFTSSPVDSGWQVSDAATMSLAIVSSQFNVTLTGSSTLPRAYRTVTIGSMTDLSVIVEIEVHGGTNVVSPGVFFGTPSGGTFPFMLFFRESDHWSLYAFSTFHDFLETGASFPTTATIKLSDVGGGNIRACYFLNEELIYEEIDAHTFGTEQYGCWHLFTAGSPRTAIFDNFSIHVGNP